MWLVCTYSRVQRSWTRRTRARSIEPSSTVWAACLADAQPALQACRNASPCLALRYSSSRQHFIPAVLLFRSAGSSVRSLLVLFRSPGFCMLIQQRALRVLYSHLLCMCVRFSTQTLQCKTLQCHAATIQRIRSGVRVTDERTTTTTIYNLRTAVPFMWGSFMSGLMVGKIWICIYGEHVLLT